MVELRPRSGGEGVLRFDISSITVEEAELWDWLDRATSGPHVRQWSRRLLLLTLEDALALPLPLAPGAPLELVGTQVRADDVVLLTRLSR